MFIKKEQIKEKIFVIAYIMFLISVMIDSSKYCVINNVLLGAHVFQILSCVIAMVKIVWDGIEILKNKNFKINYFMIVFFLMIIASFFVNQSIVLVFFLVFIIASKNVAFDKIVKITFIVQTFMLMFTVLSCKLGIIQDLIVYREDFLRHSLGCASPNCLVLQIFQIIILFLLMENKEKNNIYSFIFLGVILCIVYYVTDSRTGVACAFLAILSYYMSKKEIIKKILIKSKIIFKVLPILFSVIFIIVALLYKPLNLTKLNVVTSGRVELTGNAIEEFGIKLFGSKIVWEGQKLPEENTKSDYNYVDSSYLNILFNFGVIVYVFVMYCLAKLVDIAYKKQNYLLILIIGIIEIYCFFDSWLIGLQFNTILFLLIEVIYPLKEKENLINE